MPRRPEPHVPSHPTPPRDFGHEVRPHTRPWVRALLIAVGLLFTGAGVAGVVLPLVPGMPFLLIAAACFARSSDRFYNWLLNHPLVGPPLHTWRNHRRIPRRVKPRAVAAVLLAFGLSTWLALEDPLLRALWMGLGLGVALLITRLPSFDERLAPGHHGPRPVRDDADGRAPETTR